MRKAAWIVGIYGMMVSLGGIMGYIMAKSTYSLLFGLVSGFALELTGFGMYLNNLFSAYLALFIILILDAFFTYRFMATFTLFPSGIMCIVSLVALVIVINLISRQAKKERPL